MCGRVYCSWLVYMYSYVRSCILFVTHILYTYAARDSCTCVSVCVWESARVRVRCVCECVYVPCKTHKRLRVSATQRNTLQHFATHCSTLQQIAAHCNTLWRTATHCNIRPRFEWNCCMTGHYLCQPPSSAFLSRSSSPMVRCSACCSVLQYFSECCNIS